MSLYLSLAAASVHAEASQPTAKMGAASATALSLADYQTRLQTLDQLIAVCQQAMTPENCRSEQVGPDFQIALSSGTRPIHLAWLRGLLDLAAHEKAAQDKKVAPATQPDKQSPAAVSLYPDYVPPTLPQRLADARQRLADEAQAIQQATQPSAHATASRAAPRTTLTAILAAPEYHTAAAGRSIKQRILEKVGNWIDRFIGSLVQAGARSKWIGVTAEILFVLIVCIALVWFLIRLERQGRFAPSTLAPGIGAPSARDWQLWLQDAHEAASRAAWRDAIHLLYWSSISRLESSGLWPADRARTPREYLALLARENPQHSGLNALTRSFERTWYAGRPAAEADFHQAEQLAAQLAEKLGANSRSKRTDSPGAR